MNEWRLDVVNISKLLFAWQNDGLVDRWLNGFAMYFNYMKDTNLLFIQKSCFEYLLETVVLPFRCIIAFKEFAIPFKLQIQIHSVSL